MIVALGSANVIVQVVQDASARRHAAGRNDDVAAFRRVELLGLFGRYVDVSCAPRRASRTSRADRSVRVGKPLEQRVHLFGHRAVQSGRRVRAICGSSRLERGDREQDILRAFHRKCRDNDRAAARDAGDDGFGEVVERIGWMNRGWRK